MSSPANALSLRAATLLLLGWFGAAMAGSSPSTPTVGPVTSGPYEHVTITTDSLAPSFDSLRSFLLDCLSLHDTIILADSIYAHQPGRDMPEQIRNFIRYAYQNWQTSYVLLGGDVEHVPTRKTYVGIRPSDPWYDTIACDQYYSCLDGTWDADSNGVFGEMHDSVDLAPEVYVGRAPVSTTEEADRFVKKTLTYGRSGARRPRVFLAGFDLDDSTFAERTMEHFDSVDIQSPFECGKVYDSDSGNHADSVIHYLNQGYHYCIYSDHGCEWNIGAGFWNHGYTVWSADMNGLTNGFDSLTVFISNACLIGAFDYDDLVDDCIMEVFVNAPAGGGVAAMTNTRFGIYSPGENPQVSYSSAFVKRFVERIFGHGADTAEARDFFLGKADIIGPSVQDTSYRWCMYTVNLLGEPALKMISRDGVQECAAGPRTRPYCLIARPAIFSRSSTIEYGVGTSGNVTLGVYDAGGRRVRTVFSGRLSSGRHEAIWDGRTDLGRDAPAGVYLIALSSDEGVSTRKVVRCEGKEQQ